MCVGMEADESGRAFMAKTFPILSSFGAIAMLSLLGGCGGGGGATNSTPTPTPAPAPTPTPAPAPVNYLTPEYDASDGPEYHNAVTAYQNGASGAGITVGVIDSGIDVDNIEFAGRISSASAAFNSATSIQDQEGHGTAVATVLAAGRNNRRTLGMAWGATIMALRTDSTTNCPSTGCGHPTNYISAAMDHAVTNGAKVINISLGGDPAPLQLLNAVSRATSAGVIIVVSSGNDGSAGPDGFAASMVNYGHGLVIIATSNDARGQHSSFADGAAGWESSTLSALGDHVRSQDQNGTEILYDGTSFSAPQIAGAVALMLQAFPNLTPQQVVQRLMLTATDAGASGPDALFGMGILNVAAAFAPAGTTSLGGSQTPMSLTNNGALSTAMGDASGSATTQAIAIDSLGRAYRIGLQKSFAHSPPRAVLTPLGDMPMHSAGFSAGKFTGLFSFAPPPVRLDRFSAAPADPISRRATGQLTMTWDRHTSVGFAFSGEASNLATTLGRSASPATGFLAAQDAGEASAFRAAPDLAFGLRHRITPHLGLTLSAENGRSADLPAEWRTGDPREVKRYSQFTAAADYNSGPVGLAISATMLNEPDSLLGARLVSFFGVRGSQTLFADARANIALPAYWSLGLSARHGWTRATGGGSADIVTQAFSADISRKSLFQRGDRFAMRIAQPLRVMSGGVDALLPVAYDYVSRSADWQVSRVALAPKGREIDAELGYAMPVAGGQMSLNSYWRREPGNIVWANDDIGGAIRFTLGY
jgi:hypothetical protein